MSRHQRPYGQAAGNGDLDAAGAFRKVIVCPPPEQPDVGLQFKQVLGENALAGGVPSKLWPRGPPLDAPLRCYGAARTSLAEDAASTEGDDDVCT